MKVSDREREQKEKRNIRDRDNSDKAPSPFSERPAYLGYSHPLHRRRSRENDDDLQALRIAPPLRDRDCQTVTRCRRDWDGLYFGALRPSVCLLLVGN